MDNEERTYPFSLLVTIACWSTSLGLLAAGWLAWLVGGQMEVAILVVGTASIAATTAGVLHLRCYHKQNLRMMRQLCRSQREWQREPDPVNLRRI